MQLQYVTLELGIKYVNNIYKKFTTQNSFLLNEYASNLFISVPVNISFLYLSSLPSDIKYVAIFINMLHYKCYLNFMHFPSFLLQRIYPECFSWQDLSSVLSSQLKVVTAQSQPMVNPRSWENCRSENRWIVPYTKIFKCHIS